MTDIAAVAFTPAPAHDSPNLSRSSTADAQQTFMRLIVVCFATIRRWNPDLDLVLVTTEIPPPEFAGQLQALGTRTVITTFSHNPPPGFYPSFNASLFSIDAMQALAGRHPEDRILLLDPDVVCSGPLDVAYAAIRDGAFLAYDTGFAATEVSQGISAVEAATLHTQLDPALSGTPRHYGGEFYGFTTASWDQVAARVEQAWAFSLDRWRTGSTRFVTEEHLLNFALRFVPVLPANPYIRRIWTAPTHRTVRASDADLPLWHLPAEKNRGLSRLYGDAVSHDSWFWMHEPERWRAKASAVCGLDRRKASRWTYDSLAAQCRALQTRVADVRQLMSSLR